MPDEKPTSSKADALAKDLKASLAERRPRPWKIILGTLLVCIVGLVAFAWWMYRGPVPEPLQVIALDAWVTAHEEVKVQAQLLHPPGETKPRDLRGHKVIFHEPPPLFAKEQEPREVFVTSDEAGRASVEWAMPKTPIAEFQASSFDPNAKPARHTDHARLFVQEARKPVLLVDADETLADAALEKAGTTLTELAKDGWQVAYLVLTPATPAEFRTARERLMRQPKLPRGPLLGRFHAMNTDSPESARSELLQAIKARFHGPLQAIVGTASTAQGTKRIGIPTLLLGEANAPEGVLRVANWGEVPRRLRD